MMINMKVRLKSCFKFENGRLAIKLILNAAQANKGEFTADHSKCLEALKFNVRLLSNARVPFMIPRLLVFFLKYRIFVSGCIIRDSSILSAMVIQSNADGCSVARAHGHNVRHPPFHLCSGWMNHGYSMI